MSLGRVTLVAIVILSTLVNALPAVMPSERDSASSSITPQRALDLNGQTTRHLRARRQTTDGEDRAFDAKIPLISKLTSKNPSSEEEVLQLFNKLKLFNQKTNLLETPQFQKWTTTVSKGYKTNSEAADMAIASTLSMQHGDDVLAKMTTEAKQLSSTKDVAARLEEAQINNWLARKQPAGQVFGALKLDEEMHSIMRNLLLSTWVTYVERTEGNPYKLLLEKMKAQKFGDDTIVTMLGSAKQNPATSPIAEKVENVLFDSWKGQSADDVFKLLKLDGRGTHLFNQPKLNTWVSYVTKLEGKHADEEMYKILRASYDDGELALLLAGAKNQLMSKVAARLEGVQQKIWLSERKTAKTSFTTLKLNTK
ncbi:hypothetical protein PHYSODRAFT_288769 [Phytophthora sojae]|uniref:RxLR effector protein n=2 Tax=Phytophthora sojae TaxID=67593 RepID=G5A7M6_PHYSP|nr:hypothetical protein PHYSODRAFT_288769 [Phytophthora sojae]AEK81242.1 Avh356 [Phytophthora sojae]AEK81243.1 Avh356 [Phytophthora sojae]AEK81244.1 Avh356 [Phytophthora sojae]EGZ07902.1 hypothetical protein PHYSODRAFT_288769 [Phytophthora sojae]|eukprot:XP_009536074.1 hypothetical protein PHYSODRAFT_288769 [Phytophthora sojae]